MDKLLDDFASNSFNFRPPCMCAPYLNTSLFVLLCPIMHET